LPSLEERDGVGIEQDLIRISNSIVSDFKTRWTLIKPGVEEVLDRVVGWADVNADLRNTTLQRHRDMTTNQETNEKSTWTTNYSLRRKSKEDRIKRKEANDNTSYQEAKERRRL
jgi:hypothetical protein